MAKSEFLFWLLMYHIFIVCNTDVKVYQSFLTCCEMLVLSVA